MDRIFLKVTSNWSDISQVEKEILYDITSRWNLKKLKHGDTESRMMDSGGREVLINGYIISSRWKE
jgi:hypothetical protein